MLELFFALSLLTQLSDILTTKKLIERGGVELNPVIRFLMKLMGPGWPLGKLCITVPPLTYAYLYGYLTVLIAATVIFTLISIHNSRV